MKITRYECGVVDSGLFTLISDGNLSLGMELTRLIEDYKKKTSTFLGNLLSSSFRNSKPFKDFLSRNGLVMIEKWNLHSKGPVDVYSPYIRDKWVESLNEMVIQFGENKLKDHFFSKEYRVVDKREKNRVELSWGDVLGPQDGSSDNIFYTNPKFDDIVVERHVRDPSVYYTLSDK